MTRIFIGSEEYAELDQRIDTLLGRIGDPPPARLRNRSAGQAMFPYTAAGCKM